MNDFTKSWMIVASITLVMWLASIAAHEENPTGSQFMSDDNMLGRYTDNGEVDDLNPYGSLPSGSTGQDSTNDFTDEYRVSQSWMASSSGGNYLQDVLSAPYNILKAMQLPEVIVKVLGTFWYALLVLLTAMMLLGKER